MTPVHANGSKSKRPKCHSHFANYTSHWYRTCHSSINITLHAQHKTWIHQSKSELKWFNVNGRTVNPSNYEIRSNSWESHFACTISTFALPIRSNAKLRKAYSFSHSVMKASWIWNGNIFYKIKQTPARGGGGVEMRYNANPALILLFFNLNTQMRIMFEIFGRWNFFILSLSFWLSLSVFHSLSQWGDTHTYSQNRPIVQSNPSIRL